MKAWQPWRSRRSTDFTELETALLFLYDEGVFPHKPDRPYFESWLHRTRKQLSVSGRLTEMSMHLAREEGNTPSYWAGFLRELLDGDVVPSLDLLTRMDLLLAKPTQNQGHTEQPDLF